MTEEQKKRMEDLEDGFDEFTSMVRVLFSSYTRSEYELNCLASTLKQIISTEVDIMACLYKEGKKI